MLRTVAVEAVFQRVQILAHRWLRSVCSATLSVALIVSVVACGGGNEPSDAVNSNSRMFTVVGADKASVRFSAAASSSSGKLVGQVTVRVARDSTGAPALLGDQFPLGPVYQFTPLDMVGENIEIRIPVST